MANVHQVFFHPSGPVSNVAKTLFRRSEGVASVPRDDLPPSDAFGDVHQLAVAEAELNSCVHQGLRLWENAISNVIQAFRPPESAFTSAPNTTFAPETVCGGRLDRLFQPFLDLAAVANRG